MWLRLFHLVRVHPKRVFIPQATACHLQELVANFSTSAYGQKQAERPTGQLIFPHEERGYRYYLKQTATQSIAEPGMTQVASMMQLEWTGALKEPPRVRQVCIASKDCTFGVLVCLFNQPTLLFPVCSQNLFIEFLEPFHSGSCSQYVTCLACMTDLSCGWCHEQDACLLKTDAGSQCKAHLVLTPGDCPVCADHIDCQSCTQVGWKGLGCKPL